MIEWQRKWRSSQISPEKFKRRIGGYTTANDGIIQRHHDKNPNKNLILQQMGLRPKRGDARLRSMEMTHALGKKKLIMNGNQHIVNDPYFLEGPIKPSDSHDRKNLATNSLAQSTATASLHHQEASYRTSPDSKRHIIMKKHKISRNKLQNLISKS